MSDSKSLSTIIVATVLTTAGFASAFYGYFNYGRKARIIRKAGTAASAQKIRTRLKTERNIWKTSAYFKLSGIAVCDHPIVAPLSRAKVVHAVVKSQVCSSSWIPWSLEWVTGPLSLPNLLFPREVKEEIYEALWKLKLPDSSLISVNGDGADWKLEHTVKEKKRFSSLQADNELTSLRPSLFQKIFPTSAVYSVTRESVLRLGHSAFILGHVQDNNNSVGAHFEDEVYYENQLFDPTKHPTKNATQLVITKPTIRWFLISALSEEEILNSLDWRWRAWTAGAAVCVATAAGSLVLR